MNLNLLSGLKNVGYILFSEVIINDVNNVPYEEPLSEF